MPRKDHGPSVTDHEHWTVEELPERAAELGSDGHSEMPEDELVDALRHH